MHLSATQKILSPVIPGSFTRFGSRQAILSDTQQQQLNQIISELEAKHQQGYRDYFRHLGRLSEVERLQLKSIIRAKSSGHTEGIQGIATHASSFIHQYLTQHPGINKEKIAVVFDVDETLLDNTAFNLMKAFPKTVSNPPPIIYKNWIQYAQAPAIEAVKTLLIDIHQQNIPIYIVSKRKSEFQEATTKNLSHIGIDGMYSALSCCGERRKSDVYQEIQDGGQDIIMAIGDRLEDFEGLPISTQTFLLPNPFRIQYA